MHLGRTGRGKDRKKVSLPLCFFFSFSINLMFYYSIEALLCRRCSSGGRSKQRFAIKRCIVLLFCETKVVTKYNTCLLQHTHVTSIVSLFSHVTCVKSLFVKKCVENLGIYFCVKQVLNSLFLCILQCNGGGG